MEEHTLQLPKEKYKKTNNDIQIKVAIVLNIHGMFGAVR